ncbi:Thyrotropin-releasing hormone receptor [Frankliniella fusca]|uniref:Thyrotropin-releasing hormone receptor n=1 Tax=Frankliniella fusca TaxID=407009 RepID=A0AAE1H887_9NEOP|nr:Thyrotropin-releasing hormone receptor [Frankliniella fusca]
MLAPSPTPAMDDLELTTVGDLFNVTNATDPGGGGAEYCGTGLEWFSARYRGAHGVISLLVCLFGSVANGLNIAVLTRREMASPTNAILTGLAVADLLVMLEYIPFALHMYLLSRPPAEKYSYPWTVFVLFHANFAQAWIHTSEGVDACFRASAGVRSTPAQAWKRTHLLIEYSMGD